MALYTKGNKDMMGNLSVTSVVLWKTLSSLVTALQLLNSRMQIYNYQLQKFMHIYICYKFNTCICFTCRSRVTIFANKQTSIITSPYFPLLMQG